MNNKTTVLGIMSGSSLDGLDLCVTEFHQISNLWNYKITHSLTIELPSEFKTLLADSPTLNAKSLAELDLNYGKWIGKQINLLSIPFDLISVHGHTVFHLPEQGKSLQIGNGEVINQMTRIPTVANFRNQDIQLGGQGAPLVPMGERHLFPEFNAFINLGGICNGSFGSAAKWIAGDIGPCNQVLNHFANRLGVAFDDAGQLARSGQMNEPLMAKWSSLDFFNSPFPKSLDNQWVRDHFVIDVDCTPEDVLHTFSLFISEKIASQLNRYNPKQVMITGGGTYNLFLIEQIEKLTKVELVIPNDAIVEFKEALVFGFLGLLRIRNEINVLSCCTGATQDSCSGDIYTSH